MDTTRFSQHHPFHRPVRISSLNNVMDNVDGSRKPRRHGEDFDDLYDVTEDEEEHEHENDHHAEDIAIHIASSVKNSPTPQKPKRYPSLIIPSPTAWPTIQNYQAKLGSGQPQYPNTLLSPALVTPRPEALHSIAQKGMRHASNVSNAPSLDGSLTSDELSSLSCPSTPDAEMMRRSDARRAGDMSPAVRVQSSAWSGPVQLHPSSMRTLQRISGDSDDSATSQLFTIQEMRQVSEPMQSVGAGGPHFELTLTPIDVDLGELSSLSIPSPGGFFSSLEPSSRMTWCPGSSTEAPTTSTAEKFYSLPFNQERAKSDPLPPTPAFPAEFEQAKRPRVDVAQFPSPPQPQRNLSEESVKTAVPGSTCSPPPTTAFGLDGDVVEYSEDYEKQIQETSTANLDRTACWLQSQQVFLEGPEPDSLQKDNESFPDTTALPTPKAIPPTLPPKDPPKLGRSKSVRFAVDEPRLPESPQDSVKTETPKEPIFKQGFEFIKEASHTKDTFVHRKTRTEKLRLDRKCLFSSHVNSLEGVYEIDGPKPVTTSRPISEFYQPQETQEKQMIAAALRERRVLEQMRPVSWNLEATKFLNGGTLLTSPTGKAFPKLPSAHVLDLGGQATADWAWQVAMEYPNATVHTAYIEDQTADTSILGPQNHKTVKVPNIWTLPFPSNHFDLVSARTLHSLLRASKPPPAAGSHAPQAPYDEFDLCLRECLRVLRPGGHIEFALLDADVLHAGPLASALSVEFAFSLRVRGYDPAPTKSFLPRLRRAGFGRMRRAWLLLPMPQMAADWPSHRPSSGSTTSASTRGRSSSGGTTTGISAFGQSTENGDGSTSEASHISGLVGAWAWEKWMLKLQREMGRDGQRVLEGVPEALEEGAKTGACWRYLSGWARKEELQG